MSSTASAAGIAANQANGLKSTGPRTAEGKARVSANALKHGLRSERNPLDMATDSALSIEREEFLATFEAFKEDLAPCGPIETRLVERLAQIDLRLQRAVRMETTHLDMKFAETVIDATKAGSSLATDTGRNRDNWLLTFTFLRDPAALKLISQYESRLARDFSRTLTQFRQAQKLREQTQRLAAHESHERSQSAAIPEERSTSDLSTEQQSPVSDDRVAPAASRLAAPGTKATLPDPQTAPPPTKTSQTNPTYPASPLSSQTAQPPVC